MDAELTYVVEKSRRNRALAEAALDRWYQAELQELRVRQADEREEGVESPAALQARHSKETVALWRERQQRWCSLWG